jgi:phosphate transport system permease protein
MASSSLQLQPPPAQPQTAHPLPGRRSASRRSSRFWRAGLPAIWTSGFMLLCILVLLGGMIGLVLVRGLGQFWPRELVRFDTTAGSWIGTVQETEHTRPAGTGPAAPASVPVETATPAPSPPERILLHIGNRDLYGLDFRWFDGADITGRSRPLDAVVVEREEHGDFHGYLRELRIGGKVETGEPAWEALRAQVRVARALHARGRRLDARYENAREPITRLERARDLARRRDGAGTVSTRAEIERKIAAESERLRPVLDSIAAERDRVAAELAARTALFTDAGGQEREVPLAQIVRAWRPNTMHGLDKTRLYAARLWEFLAAAPRESNTEGGILPALYGTVLMVLLMTVAVVPFGVVAALYLHEYARPGLALRAVRLAVSNLAGVPSIVFGMFGLAFFVYGVGGLIDRTFFADALPNPTFGTGGILWAALTLALLTLPVVVVSAEEGLTSVPRANREGALALGATKWQTLWHVVLPQAAPGILTGVILAVSRAAGEVAPLMLTGVVKLAPALAMDGQPPFFHLERKFMHLGFHIYDVSMQSPNVEAAKPMVYSTTLLLLLLVVALNTTAIVMRNRMRRRYRGAVL